MGKNHPAKLVLNRETVRDLTKDVLRNVEGGKWETRETMSCACDTTDPSLRPLCPFCELTCGPCI